MWSPQVINIVAIGKSPPAWVVDAYGSYHDRLKHICPIQLIEIPACPHSQKKCSIAKEGEKISAHLASSYVTVALDRAGKHLDSLAFAKLMATIREQSQHQSFVIGGSDGLSVDILHRSQHIISLSELTFTHYFARVVLIEQIYRGWCIMNHHPYHK
jgi:23S rRNA (pseudouridine1915-N3)-methyltransferase